VRRAELDGHMMKERGDSESHLPRGRGEEGVEKHYSGIQRPPIKGNVL
jgi:hypothetical protein